MKIQRLRTLVFLALCCDLGLFSKYMIAPVSNAVSDIFQIPGGINTSFSLVFLLSAAMLVPHFGVCTLMSLVQALLAFFLGMTGRMGAFAAVSYLVPGMGMDVMLHLLRRRRIPMWTKMTLVNALSSLVASLTADLLVFHLHGMALLPFLLSALFFGGLFGLFGAAIVARLSSVLRPLPLAEGKQ